MGPKVSNDEDEKRSYRNQGLATGIFHWQELGHLDFQDLIELARTNDSEPEETEWNLDE